MDAFRLSDAASAHLVLRPLTAAERGRGEALRVLQCVRAAEPDALTWAVLYFKRGAFIGEEPQLAGVGAMLSRILSCNAVPACDSMLICDDDWSVREFQVTLPLNTRFFSLRCGAARCSVGWSRRNELLDAHYLEIRHAAADDAYERWLFAGRDEGSGVRRAEGPLMSIVTPAYKTPPVFLREMIDSVRAQRYENWELVLVNASPDDEGMREVLASYDDDRIQVIEHPTNDGIAGNTNVGIAASHGAYVSFLDHDDLLEPDALLQYVEAIERSEEPVDMLYCDEDSLNEHGTYGWPLFKPTFNPDLLYSNNYVIHWLTVSRFVLDRTTRSSKDVDGAQDYDLTLKAGEVARKIVRVPRVLYHWRIHQGSINANPDSKPYAQLAGQRALEGHFERRGVSARVNQESVVCTYRSNFLLPDASAPRVTCALMGDVATPALFDALNAYASSTETGSYEVLRYASDTPVERNKALEEASGQVILYVSSPIGSVSEDAIGMLAGCMERAEVAAVSPQVLRADGLIDYAGLCIQPSGKLMYMSRYLPTNDYAYVGRSQRPYDALLVNHALLMLRVDDACRAGGFDASFETSAYASACLCMTLHQTGMLAVYLASVRFSQAATGSLLASTVGVHAVQDRDLLARRFGILYGQGDPSHNPNFDPESAYYRLKW